MEVHNIRGVKAVDADHRYPSVAAAVTTVLYFHDLLLRKAKLG